jgi:hypothetical protein
VERKDENFITFNCENCGKETTQRKSDYDKNKTHFCSKECYREMQKTGIYKYSSVKTICNYCGKEICIQKSRENYNKKHFCDEKCAYEYKRQQSINNKVAVKCDYCGEEFNLTPYRANRSVLHFCNIDCKDKYNENLTGKPKMKINKQETKKDIDEKTQNIINIIMNKNPKIIFKKCSCCERLLPCDDVFFSKDLNGKEGYRAKCKECENNKGYKFKIEIPWYTDFLFDDIYSDYRKMSNLQIENKYKACERTVSRELNKKGYDTRKENMINNFTKEEIVYMYKSLLHGDIKQLTNGIMNSKNIKIYFEYIIEYLFKNHLRYETKNDIINNINYDKLETNYKLASILRTLKYGMDDILTVINNIYGFYISNGEINGRCYSKDGNIFTSKEERDVYEYIQSNKVFKDVIAVGIKTKNNSKYKFKSKNKKMFPDFVIEEVYIKDSLITLSKPIILEYYGLYKLNAKNKRNSDYVEKTKFKEEFYKNNKDIYYIGIFPDDIKNNFKGLAEKLSLFCMENFKEIA